MKFDGTKLLVTGGVLLIGGAAVWRFVGSFVLWALWQVALYYLVLIVVALVMYGGLYLAVGREERPSKDVVIER